MFNPRERFRPITLFAYLLVAWVALCRIASAAPSITLSKKSGPPTSKILVSGRGFEPNVGVDIYFDTKDEALVVTNDRGGFENTKIQAPRSAYPGQHWVTALERNNDKGAQKPFLVQTDWSEFGFDANHTRFNPFENALNPKTVGRLDLQWSSAFGSLMQSAPAVANGVVYVGSGNNNVHALNARTGERLWSSAITTYLSSPAVINRVLYVGSYDGNVYALDANTGAKLWTYTTGGQVESSPTVANGVVYVGSYDGNIYALKASTGAKLWNYTTGYYVGSSPAVANGVVYVGSADDNLYALDANTGTKLWSYTTGGEIFISGSSVQNGVVYVGSSDSNVYALNASTGALLWSYATANGIGASLAVANGVVYVSSDDGNLYALDASTGIKLWNYSAGVYVSSPAVANGVVYVGSGDYKVYALNASTGTKLWSYTTGDFISYASPSIADGVVYIGSDSGTIYAFGLPNGPLTKQDAASKHPDLKTLRPDLNLKVSRPGATQSGAEP